MILEDPELLHLGYINACREVSDVSPTVAYYYSSLTVTMTQSTSPSSQTNTLVSVQLDGLINILLGLGLDNRMAISAALQEAGTGQNVTEEPVANDSAASTTATTDISATVPHDAASPTAAPVPHDDASPAATATPTAAPSPAVVDSDNE
ncbi:uncharacterized protein HD556DRAFT_1437869 [Suillus plorans]|uniref:Uncharacterized protein n=1 Tax=Suillus plorans TaxID=116603 RepID=A0A9P7J4W4_9AGAM|nr:uncharacterized protein HD556DRAFT_1437869 [Suillus plorans]KAG1802807.1 hypothetical protein HD556DRAFT_1437869 [Suillus plorans]